ncbi:MAG: hypothetical protein FJ308_06685 [Planctomycetes bacterium]|nr:hypothetical protein [Planctomycetota bacterium]
MVFLAAAFFLATFFLVAAFFGAAAFLAAFFLATFFFVAPAFFLATDTSSKKIQTLVVAESPIRSSRLVIWYRQPIQKVRRSKTVDLAS